MNPDPVSLSLDDRLFARDRAGGGERARVVRAVDLEQARRKEVAVEPADDLLAVPSDDAFEPSVDEPDPPVEVPQDDQRRAVIENRLQPGLGCAQGLLPLGERPIGAGQVGRARGDASLQVTIELRDLRPRARPLRPARRLGHGPHDRRWQSRQVLLEDVVGRPRLEPLDRDVLAHRARDEQEGHLGHASTGEAQGRQAVKGRQVVVGEDDVEATSGQRTFEGLSRVHDADLAGKPSRPQAGRHEFGVVGVVLEMEDPKGRRGRGLLAVRRLGSAHRQ